MAFKQPVRSVRLRLAFAWKNLQTFRKFGVISYLDHLKVKLLYTSDILQRIVGLVSPWTHQPREIPKHEEERAYGIREMYTLAFHILDENTARVAVNLRRRTRTCVCQSAKVML